MRYFVEGRSKTMEFIAQSYCVDIIQHIVTVHSTLIMKKTKIYDYSYKLSVYFFEVSYEISGNFYLEFLFIGLIECEVDLIIISFMYLTVLICLIIYSKYIITFFTTFFTGFFLLRSFKIVFVFWLKIYFVFKSFLHLKKVFMIFKI